MAKLIDNQGDSKARPPRVVTYPVKGPTDPPYVPLPGRKTTRPDGRAHDQRFAGEKNIAGYKGVDAKRSK